MASIGIMGGTFNPIHNGHIAIADAAYHQFHLDKVIFMPNHIPGYKKCEELLSGKERLAMLQEAISPYSYFEASDFELNRSGKTYTAQTLSLLHEKYPDTHFYFIMGADSLFTFDKWKEPATILKYATILAAPRDDADTVDILDKITSLEDEFKTNKFHIIKCPYIDCSSSNIRKTLKQISYITEAELPALAHKLQIPQNVITYIFKNHLYSEK